MSGSATVTPSRIRRLAAGTVTACLLAGSLIASALAAPALADQSPVTPPPPPAGSGPTGSGSSSGGSYTATVAEQVNLSGDVNPGFDEQWTPPECWLQPEFHQPQTFSNLDPTGGKTDADSYWWWFGSHYPGFGVFIHGVNGYPEVQAEFKQEQDKKRPAGWTGPNPITADDVWWVPNWLDGAQGWACVQGLLANENLSDGFIGMMPPAQPGAGGGQGQISSEDLSKLARAALKLPTVSVVTSPPTTTPATVNVPTYVSVHYDGNPQPSDTAEVTWADGTEYLSATVQASKPTVTVSTSAPGGSYTSTTDNTCAEAGDQASPACSITFRAPSGGTPYAITVTVSWTVTWTTNVGDGGTFPAATATGTSTVQVREIQTAG